MPSYSYGEMIEHYLVRRNDNGWVTIDDEEYFENLVKLVEVCHTVSAEVSLEELISLPCHCT